MQENWNKQTKEIKERVLKTCKDQAEREDTLNTPLTIQENVEKTLLEVARRLTRWASNILPLVHSSNYPLPPPTPLQNEKLLLSLVSLSSLLPSSLEEEI
jgi:hypothetical protein